MRSSLFVRVGADRLDPSDALAFVADPGAGATVLFEGSVRDHSADGDVTGLAYEAWDETGGAGPNQLQSAAFTVEPRLKDFADRLGTAWQMTGSGAAFFKAVASRAERFSLGPTTTRRET